MIAPFVAVLMGSDSDWPAVGAAVAVLRELEIPFEARILSAHRTPQALVDYLADAERRGAAVHIAAAGMAAHLAGAVAAHSQRPVIGVPLDSGLGGVDALLATVQMPAGVPVATTAIGRAGAANGRVAGGAHPRPRRRGAGGTAGGGAPSGGRASRRARPSLAGAAAPRGGRRARRPAQGRGVNAGPRLRIAAEVLRAGGLVAYPTEGVWGLGCDPDDELAVARLLDLKRRSAARGLILIGADSGQFHRHLRGLAAALRKRFEAPQSHGATWLVPDNGTAPPWIRGRHQSVALRVTTHPLAAALCRLFGGPLVSTSANAAGARAPRHAFQARRLFRRRRPVYVLPGPLGALSGPTPIADLSTGAVLRHG